MSNNKNIPDLWSAINNDNNFHKTIDNKKANKDINIIAGSGLIGGGNLSNNMTLNISSANEGILVNENNIQINTYNGTDSNSIHRPLSAAMGSLLYSTALHGKYVGNVSLEGNTSPNGTNTCTFRIKKSKSMSCSFKLDMYTSWNYTKICGRHSFLISIMTSDKNLLNSSTIVPLQNDSVTGDFIRITDPVTEGEDLVFNMYYTSGKNRFEVWVSEVFGSSGIDNISNLVIDNIRHTASVTNEFKTICSPFFISTRGSLPKDSEIRFVYKGDFINGLKSNGKDLLTLDDIASNVNGNGFQKIGKTIIQYGEFNGTGVWQRINLPIAFSNANYKVIVNHIVGQSGSGGDYAVYGINTTGFTTAGYNGFKSHWIAIGS